MKSINLIKSLTLSAVLAGALFLNTAIPAHAASHLKGGDWFNAFNNTTQEGTWRDPVSGKPGEIIEFHAAITNDGDQPAERVQFWGSQDGRVPQDPAKQLVVKARIANAAFGGEELTDTATVNVIGDVPQGLRYLPGHARIHGVTSKYNCPNDCTLPDENILPGIDIGDIAPGATVEISYKVFITNIPGPTATPNPTEVPTVTPAPTVTPSQAPNQNIQCPSGTTFQRVEGNNIICINNANNNNNTSNSGGNSQTQTNNNNQTVNVTVPSTSSAPVVLAAQTSSVKELPNTGLPLAGLALTGLTPLGLKLKKFGKASDSLTPNFIWGERAFNKEA